MFELLPLPGTEFPLARQVEWFRAFISSAALCYGFPPDEIEPIVEDDRIKFVRTSELQIDPDWSE
jgi:hypothetical protein